MLRAGIWHLLSEKLFEIKPPLNISFREIAKKMCLTWIHIFYSSMAATTSRRHISAARFQPILLRKQNYNLKKSSIEIIHLYIQFFFKRVERVQPTV
jgi:hypothetical protein